MDATGKEVKTVNIIDAKDSTCTLPLHEIPSGIYTLLLTMSNQNTRLVRLAIQWDQSPYFNVNQMLSALEELFEYSSKK